MVLQEAWAWSSVVRLGWRPVTALDPVTTSGDRSQDVACQRELDNQRLTDLILRTAHGQEDGFEDLYDSTVAQLYGIALRILRSQDQAAEVIQETYVQIWSQAARYTPDSGGAFAWILAIVHRRAVARVRGVGTAAGYDYCAPATYPNVNDPEAGELTPDTARVGRGLASLTVSQREAVTLAYFDGHSQRQLAQLLELPLETVQDRIRDGLIGLQRALAVN